MQEAVRARDLGSVAMLKPDTELHFPSLYKQEQAFMAEEMIKQNMNMGSEEFKVQLASPPTFLDVGWTDVSTCSNCCLCRCFARNSW